MSIKDSSSAETRERSALAASVKRLHSALRRCPILDKMPAYQVPTAQAILAEANHHLNESVRSARLLAELDGVSTETLILANRADTVLELTRSALSMLVAELDGIAA